MNKLSPVQVREIVEREIDRLLIPWMVGRPDTYVMDSQTRYVVATGFWLDEELRKFASDSDRKTQCWKFNRLSRTYDVWETASECINEAIDGTVEQDRKPHRRWG